MPSPVLSPRQFEWVLAAFGATLAAHMLWLPVWLSALLGIAVLARWLQRRRFGMGWPGWVKFPLLLLTIIVIFGEFGDPTSRQAGTAALTGFCTLKLIETERRRDGLLMLTVCLFLISIQFLFNEGMLITAYMVVPCLLTFLALNEVSAPPGTRGGLASRLGPVTRELVPLLAVTLPLTIFLFFSVPRLSSPLWGSPTVADGGRTALGGEMAPGSITELLADDTPAFRVTFEGPVPPNSALYWRGPVLWRFEGGVRWLAMRSRQEQLGRSLIGPTFGAPGDIRYNVTLEPTDRTWLFLLDLPTGLPSNSRRLSDGQVIRDQPVTSAFAYDAASDLSAATPIGLPKDDQFSGIQRDPRLNPRTTELARQWIAEIGPDRERLVQRALQYFNEEEFRYSLSPPPLTSADRIDEFLFDTREGFCEHYSSSFTMLMRAAGVPARVVTGYLGGDYNNVGGYLVVRNSDAHAWSEVLIEGRGWVRVDPTSAVAPERVELGSAGAGGAGWGQSEWLKAARDRLDALQSWWNRNMVQFNAGSQRSFFDTLGIDPSDWRHAAAWMAGGLGVIGLFAAALFYRKLIRRPSEPGARAYAKFLKRLRESGVERGPSEGPLDFGERAARQLPQWADEIALISRAFGAIRYGQLDAAASGRLEAAVAMFLERSRG